MQIVAVNRPLSPEQTTGLSDLLKACIDQGSVVGFLAGTAPEATASYWTVTIKAACEGRVALFVSLDNEGQVLGTIQVTFHFPPNQSHVAGIQSLLVHPRCRRQGVGRQLMHAVENLCRRLNRQVLVLQTAGGPAGALYVSLGFAVSGMVPDLYRKPDGSLTDGYMFYKRI